MKNHRKKLYLPLNYLSRLVTAPALLLILLINIAVIFGYFVDAPFFVEIVTSWSAAVIGFSELLIIGGMIIYMVANTHHLAGPLHGLENALKAVGEGDLTAELKFRKNDYHQNIPATFNENIGRLRERIVVLQKITESLADAPNEEESRKLLDQLHQGILGIKTSPTS